MGCTYSKDQSCHPDPSGINKQQQTIKTVRIIHFNDVYEIEDRDPQHPGAAKFSTKIKEQVNNWTYKLFSGDCLNPSELSSKTKGAHMIEVMNELEVDAAVYGNHEFDFGINPLKEALQGMNFPWICSNLRDKQTNEVLAATHNSKGEKTGVTKIIQNWKTQEGNTLKVGLIGLVEVEWLETLNKVSLDDIIYEDYVTVAKRLVEELEEEECELIIALTHMREPNDVRLARNIDGIHLILGGHDHHYNHQVMSDVHILKSGSEFREFSTIDIKFVNGKINPTFHRHELSQDYDRIKPDKRMNMIVDGYTEEMRKERVLPLIESIVNIETRFARVRTRESNFGNFIADCMRQSAGTEIALLNSGTLRSDRLFEKGMLTLGDLQTILPMLDRTVKMKVKGHILRSALENSVSQYPTTSGRFLQVSGLSFKFQPANAKNERVQDIFIVNRGQLCDDEEYTVATKAFVANGKDGFECFMGKDVDKQPCATEAELDNLPVLRHDIIQTLKDMHASGQTFDLTVKDRIINLESQITPSTSATNHHQL